MRGRVLGQVKADWPAKELRPAAPMPCPGPPDCPHPEEAHDPDSQPVVARRGRRKAMRRAAAQVKQWRKKERRTKWRGARSSQGFGS